MSGDTLAAYYEQNEFNPVPIPLDTPEAWNAHLAKRVNLYERHLGIPPSLFLGRSAIEFGCNSGENALVLAHYGADITLVEPNEQVLPRLRELFKRYGLDDRISELLNAGITEYETQDVFDLAVCEGFLYTMDNRDEMLAKLCRLIAPSGYGVVSFNDRYGMCVEYLKRLVFWRACQAAGVTDVHGGESVEVARRLFGEDFAALNASRPFEAWWKDVLVNPFIADNFFWSYQDVIPIIEAEGCEFISTSPRWSSVDSFSWYKNILPTETLHRNLLDDWSKQFAFFLTGIPIANPGGAAVDADVLEDVLCLMRQISAYTAKIQNSVEKVTYPGILDAYLERIQDESAQNLRGELRAVFQTLAQGDVDEIYTVYLETKTLRNLWGAPYHYISFKKKP